MMLHKPSDKTSSDPIEFWYMPEPSNEFQIGNPTFQQPQQVFNQTTNNNLKRSKQQPFQGEESTGTITFNNIKMDIHFFLIHLANFVGKFVSKSLFPRSYPYTTY